MKNLLTKFKNIKRETIVKNSFLLPILLVVFMSISHVVSWYDLGNPISWAIYLSVAIEIFALASVSAAGINVGRFSVWALFGLVTSIQIIGNIFFTYQDIDIASSSFKSWVELVQPWFIDWEPVDHRRLLALIQGGTLPAMSLIALHYYIKFNDVEKTEKKSNIPIIKTKPFSGEVLEKIYKDHSNVEEESDEAVDNAENLSIVSKEILIENEQEEISIETNEPSIEELIEEKSLESEISLYENSKEYEESLEISQPLESEINASPDIEESIIEESSIDENVIVEKVTVNSSTSNTPQSQWAGATKRTFQNPQAMPGIN